MKLTLRYECPICDGKVDMHVQQDPRQPFVAIPMAACLACATHPERIEETAAGNVVYMRLRGLTHSKVARIITPTGTRVAMPGRQ